MPEAVVEKKQAQTVVTSENRAEFMEKKLDLAPAAKPKPEAKDAPKADDKKADAKPAAEPKQEGEGDKDEKKGGQHGINERFSKLTEQRKAAEATAATERAAREKAEAEAAELRAKLTPKHPDADEPQRAQFNNDEEYLKSLTDYRVEKALESRDQKAAKAREEAAQTERLKSWRDRVAATQKEVPDYQARIEASTVMVSDQVREAILESEVGPKILLHLADNPEEAASIAKLTIGGALKAIGRLEAKLEAPAKTGTVTEEGGKPAKVEISQAPAPISPLKGNGAAVEEPVNSKGEFVGDYQTWKRLRKEGKIK